MKRWKFWFRRLIFSSALATVLFYALFWIIWIANPFPVEKLDRSSDSPVVLDRHGQRLIAVVNSEGQWCYSVPLEKISPWLIKATLAAEDSRFLYHDGVDYRAIFRATLQNVTHAQIVSGASTLTMQLCRQIERRPRTFYSKFWQIFRAWQLEALRSKDEILEAYLNFAPYGGNIQGVEAAARRYFDKSAEDLSLGEAALLAGLPQSPNRFRPDRHVEDAKVRRQFVLRRMLELGVISTRQAEDAGNEPINCRRKPQFQSAPHAAGLALHRRPQGGRTTLDMRIQKVVESKILEQVPGLPPFADVAVCVMDISSGDLLAWVGSANPEDPHDGQVDGAIAKRSPGSALKPFLYAAAFQTRRLARDSVVYDGAIERAGWTPENFDHTFSGDVTVEDALRRSLNVPAILVAEQVGLQSCLGNLRSVGIALPDDAEARGGLALAVGGIEVSLVDLVAGYATLGRLGRYRSPRLFLDESREEGLVLDRDVCSVVNDILSVKWRRPKGWESLSDTQLPWCMWKTGTSSKRRDAWAIGHNSHYAIGVWVGRFSGAGHVDFVGRDAAEPLLAKLFACPELRRFERPAEAMSWKVERPFRFQKPNSGPLRILSPAMGDVMLTRNGPAVIHPTMNDQGQSRWFLNGRLIAEQAAPRLELQAGRYELRCVDQQGRSAAVEFAVQSTGP